MLHSYEYSSPILQWCLVLSGFLYKPFWRSYDNLLSVVIASIVEKRHPLKLFLKRFCLISPLVLTCIIFSPFAIVGFTMRCVLYSVRHPYRLSVLKTVYNQLEQKKRNKFGIGTMNLCLLPEYMSRNNYLTHTTYRAGEIGKRIVVDQMFYDHKSNNTELSPGQRNTKPKLTTGLAAHFPNMDFICIQEVFQSHYSDILKGELHKIYPYIICDVGIFCKNSNNYGLNSGLMFASKYEILDADFQYYKDRCKQGNNYYSKGLLMIKVLLWFESFSEDKAVVGYMYVTHLQAYQGKECILNKQLDDIVKWTGEFREETKKDNDIIAFDMVCGDFNFDNISPGEKLVREHEIFTIYKDEGRVRSGIEKDWTVGTKMRQLNMYNEEVLTPEGLKSCLETPIKRQQYIVDGDIEEANMDTIVYAQPKKELCPVGGKRRIDYILYNNTFPVVPVEYNFVTRLPTLSDHIPVVMQFQLPGTLH